MKNELTQELVRELLDYNPDTGVFTWKWRDQSLFSAIRYQTSWNSRYAGRKAGAIQNYADGYRRLVISITLGGKSKSYAAHRLAWLYMHGTLPSEILDHENRNALDNRIDNIRSANHDLNCGNKSLAKNNTSGIVGVYREKGRWSARPSIGGGKTAFLGYFDQKEDAAHEVAKFRQDHGMPMHNHAQYLRR
ncbi:HNH endonuclease signature motif containing protein [Halomonas sp.]|uniref:HNH endonuclease signature motif containing protein n=1 Tax=Halomonas sp. TaxID=1486246 RepID=UPI003F9AD8E8